VSAIRWTLRRLLADERGATAIEYGLIVALISIAVISGMSSLGGGSNGMWTHISDDVSNAMN